MDNIKSAVFMVISDLFKVSVEELNENIGPGELPKWDSLGQIRLISSLEQKFDLEFSINDIMEFNSIKDIVNIIHKKKKLPVPLENEIKEKKFHSVPLIPIRHPNLVYWGENSFNLLNKIIEGNKVTFIKSSSKYAQKLVEQFKLSTDSSIEVTLIDKPLGEPTEKSILEIRDILLKITPNQIIALGGGSVIDSAKLGLLLYENSSLNLKELLFPNSVPKFKRKTEFIAIPTIFGSGAEASSAALFSFNDTLGKSIIVSDDFIPDKVILDPILSLNLDLPFIFSSAFDALSHAIEGYVSIIDVPLIEPYAIWSVKKIVNALERLIEEEKGRTEILSDLCYASYYAGIVQNHRSVGLAHSISHQLGKFNISHSVGTALFLAPVMEFNSKLCNTYKKLALLCNYNDPLELIEKIKSILIKSKIIPDKKKLNLLLENSRQITLSAIEDITFKTNPVICSYEEVKSLFENTIKGYIDAF